MRDLFDVVDIRKDGYIDRNEWNNTFNNIDSGSAVNTFKPTPIPLWENSKESDLLGEAIARNRHQIQANLLNKEVTFKEAKKALDDILHNEFTKKGIKISDVKLKIFL